MKKGRMNRPSKSSADAPLRGALRHQSARTPSTWIASLTSGLKPILTP